MTAANIIHGVLRGEVAAAEMFILKPHRPGIGGVADGENSFAGAVLPVAGHGGLCGGVDRVRVFNFITGADVRFRLWFFMPALYFFARLLSLQSCTYFRCSSVIHGDQEAF